MHVQWFLDLVLYWRCFPRFLCKFGWGQAGVEFMQISCCTHADFMFTLNFHNALCNILHRNGVEFMLSSCWIQAKPWKVPKFAIIGLFMLYTIRNTVWDFSQKTAKVVRKRILLRDLLEFSMNSTPLWCKMLHKALWKFKVKMKSAWIRHEFNTNLISITVQNIVQFKLKMKSAWIRHEINTNLVSITVQSIVKKSVYKSSSKHYSLSVSFLN